MEKCSDYKSSEKFTSRTVRDEIFWEYDVIAFYCVL
jgi:hypothetical protein